MRLRRNQEEILKLHALGRRARCKLNSLHLPEHECHRVPELHACQVNTDTRPSSGSEGVKVSLRGWREGFGGVAFFGDNPAVGVEAGAR